jgi:hypothetical protein
MEVVMMMKKALIIFIFAVVFLFNTVGFFSISQDNLLEGDNISLVYAFYDESGNTFTDIGNEAANAGVAAKNPISKSSFAILGSALIMMLLIKSKDSH